MAKNYRAELTGVFGDPVDGNPSCVLAESGYNALGLNFRYLTMRVSPENLKAAFEGAKAIGMKGFNLTMPHKVAIISLLDELSQEAKVIGAVNTVINKDGKWYGENTDGKGFLTSLEKERVDVKGNVITVLGAGGAAKAIAVECALTGASKIKIINRDKVRGEELAYLINTETKAAAEFLPWTPNIKIPSDTDILVQGTCVGLFPNSEEKPDIDYSTIHEKMVVTDVVFNPVISAFLNEAKKRGAKTVTGIGMLVYQAALNFEYWTGEKAPVELIYKALENEFLNS